MQSQTLFSRPGTRFFTDCALREGIFVLYWKQLRDPQFSFYKLWLVQAKKAGILDARLSLWAWKNRRLDTKPPQKECFKRKS
jgi:hypothetical protein